MQVWRNSLDIEALIVTVEERMENAEAVDRLLGEQRLEEGRWLIPLRL